MTTPAGQEPSVTPAPGRCLRVSGLRFGYPQQLLFDRWSHVFPAGLTWIEGDNGCGKSTLLGLLAGILTPLAGTRSLNGIDADRQPARYRHAIAHYAPDLPADPADPATPPDSQTSARACLQDLAGAGLGDTQAQVAELVQAMGLADFLDKPIAHLSKGSRRKVAIIGAIIRPTAAIVLDEPLAALDLRSQTVVQSCLANAARQDDRIWIVASHEPLVEAAGVAHRLTLPAIG